MAAPLAKWPCHEVLQPFRKTLDKSEIYRTKEMEMER